MKQKKRKKKEERQEGKLTKWQILKMIWAHPRYKAMIKLGGYFLFLFMVVIFIQLNKPTTIKDYEPQDPLVKYEGYYNYQYQYTLIQNGNTQIVDGIRMDDQEVFQIQGTSERYLLEQNKIFLFDENGKQNVLSPLSYSLINVRPNHLKKIIDESKKLAKTEYENGSHMLLYEIKASDFYRLYNNTEVKLDVMVEIMVTIENNQVTKVALDLTNAVQQMNSGYKQLQFEFAYSNIGQMREL